MILAGTECLRRMLPRVVKREGTNSGAKFVRFFCRLEYDPFTFANNKVLIRMYFLIADFFNG